MSNQRGLDYYIEYIEYNKRAYLRQNGTPSFFKYILLSIRVLLYTSILNGFSQTVSV